MAHSGLSECAIFVAYHMSKITKTFNAKIVDQRKDGGRILISTPAPDRDKDRVIPAGVKIDNYLKNPVVQWGHDYSSPYSTIGRTTSLEVTPDGIVAEFELRPAVNDQDPQNVVKLLWEGGWVKAASIGFLPTKGTKNEFGGMDFSESELLEWSLVSIPANQQALRLAAKGLDMNKTIAVKSPDYRLPDETVDACNARKFQELMDADPSLSEADARAQAAKICEQSAPSDKPADAPPPDAPAKDAGGDMAQYVTELAAHLSEALSICQELMGAMQPQDTPPPDAPPSDQPAQNSVSPESLARSVAQRLRNIDAPVTKRGRVLSAGNESKLRTAHTNIGEVLSQLGEDAPEQSSAGKQAEEAELKFLKELAASLGDLPKVFSK